MISNQNILSGNCLNLKKHIAPIIMILHIKINILQKILILILADLDTILEKIFAISGVEEAVNC